MDLGKRIAGEALALVGVAFRLHGRTEESGLDCVGLAALALARAGVQVGDLPPYQLRGTSLIRVEEALRVAGFEPVAQASTGDMLIALSGSMQLHLMIQTGKGIVHADAGLGRVVCMPAPSPWPILGSWRWAETNERG